MARKKTVGLTWRSERAGELLSDKTCDICDVPHWAEFFERLKNKVRFVSLQYGETEDDIAFARWKYGVEIYQDKCIDNFNDVDAAAAQIAALDYVVSISTTAAHFGWGSRCTRLGSFAKKAVRALARRGDHMPVVSNLAAGQVSQRRRMEVGFGHSCR
jgi:hypothetical protein